MSKRVLIAGVGPLPTPALERLHAPGLRLWAMTQILLKGGHHVLTAEAAFGGGAPEKADTPITFDTSDTSDPSDRSDGSDSAEAPAAPKIRHETARWARAALPLDVEGATSGLRALADAFRPEVVVTTTDIMALAAVRARVTQPLYVDYFGDPMAERQMQGAIHNNDAALLAAWAYMLPVLLRADRFSACSNFQRLGLIGMLAAAGRLNRHTSGHDLVDVLRQGLSYERQMQPPGQYRVRERVVPNDAFIVVFTGGYNTWLDEDSLYVALETAMRREPRLHFVSTGGDLRGHNTATLERFRAKIEKSSERERFHFLGWIRTHEVADVCDQADAAICLDRWSHEAEFGLRNRIYLWMRLGVPVVTTAISEEIRAFAARKLVAAVPVGQPHLVAETLLEMAAEPERGKKMAAAARSFIDNDYTFESLMRPLAQWAAAPSMAPDRLHVFAESIREGDTADGERDADEPVRVHNPLADAQAHFLDMAAALKEERRRRREAEEELARLGGSRVVKMYKSFFKK